jgi:CheY-like chemotaxis protein
VECADDGLAGIDLLNRVKPDIGIVDIGLPGIDGFEVARRLRAGSGRAPYLIALTGYGQPADVERAREAGFDRLITKPVDMAALRRILETAE